MKVRFLSIVMAVMLVVVAGGVAQAGDENLEELLVQVGEDYAKAYTSPFLYGFGPNQNANLFSTAHIPWTGLTFGLGVKAMGTQLHDDDKTFQIVKHNVDLSDYDDSIAPGTMGDVVLSGPTIFGDENTAGRAQGYIGGIEVFDQATITGLMESSFVPMVTPEFYVGGIVGLKLLVRWFPEIELSNYGKTSYLGYGLQWNANGVLKNLPVDIMIGFFDQKLEVGTMLESTGTSYHLAVSKSFPALTVYGGFAIEESAMDVSYTYEETGDNIAFTTEGIQDNRFTIGVTFDILLKLNLEMGHGEMTTYSAGLMFGF